MRKIFVLSLVAIFAFSLVNGVLAWGGHGGGSGSDSSDNDQTIENSSGTITNNITVRSSTGSNQIKLGGKIYTGDSSSYIGLNNLINTNTLSGNLRGDQSIRNSSGTVNNNLTANSYTGSNSIGTGCCRWPCNRCNNLIQTGKSSSWIDLRNGINLNSKTPGNIGTQTISGSHGTVNNNLTANSSTGSNVIYLGGRISTGLSSGGVEVVNIVNQNIVGN